MSIISNEHQSKSPFECPGCFRTRGECECPPRSAKRVFCQSKNVDQTLEKHADEWVLVAVLASKNTTYQEGELDWRELYFERRAKGGPDEG